MGDFDTYTSRALAYLHSSAGQGTQPNIAARLLAIGPGQLGMSSPPTPRQLHTARRLLEDLARLDQDQNGAGQNPCSAIHPA